MKIKKPTHRKKENPGTRGYKKSSIDLADLYQFYRRFDDKGLKSMACFTGYRIPDIQDELVKETIHGHPFTSEKGSILREKLRFYGEEKISLTFFRGRSRRKKSPEEHISQTPDAFINTDAFTEEEIMCEKEVVFPPAPSLLIWSRIWPFLRGIQGSTDKNRKVYIL